MAASAVIIVPSQGMDVGAFQSVAQKLGKTVFGDDATILKTRVTRQGDSFTVTLTTLKGDAFLWDDVGNLSTVLTISHGFTIDGPNLGYGDTSLNPSDLIDIYPPGDQPWGLTRDRTELSAAGKQFWISVGDALDVDGKIILLGCAMGRPMKMGKAYGAIVAEVAKRRVYASTGTFGAGDLATALKYVVEIENKEKVSRPMQEFAPPSP